ncbi:hypothetical protein [Streptomyces sp. 6N223]|uniref:hypothetical protein n=1 Tax=Streptomyces sp. 6N223 TaxID=3457412 RepID=UPI003FD5A547
MTLITSRWPFRLVEDSLAAGVRHLSPGQARDLLYRPDADPAFRDALWRQVIVAAQREGAGSSWQALTAWLALPGLRRSVRSISFALRADHQDLQAEALLAVLETLNAIDPEPPEPGGRLVKAAIGRVWAYAKLAAPETPVADVAAVLPVPDRAWELEIQPPDRPEGLAAPLRFTVPRTTRPVPKQAPDPDPDLDPDLDPDPDSDPEEERLTDMAHRLGLRDIVYRARRPGEGTPIGVLSLRPAGAAP